MGWEAGMRACVPAVPGKAAAGRPRMPPRSQPSMRERCEAAAPCILLIASARSISPACPSRQVSARSEALVCLCSGTVGRVDAGAGAGEDLGLVAESLASIQGLRKHEVLLARA